MNNNPIAKLIASITTLATACALAIGGLLLAPSAARADEGTPTPAPFADGSRIEFLCREQGRALEGQQDRLNVANDLAAKTETWINEQKAKGKDVSALESALASFESSLASAQAKHDEAQSAHDSQSGFDGNCKMTDRDQAKTTLRTVGDDLREAGRILRDAGREFRRAVQEWRKANRPTQPTAVP